MRLEISEDMLAACVDAADRSLYTCRSLLEHLRGEHGTLNALLQADKITDGTESDIQEANAYLAAQAMSYGREIRRLEAREEFLEKRMDHAIRALRRKKLYSESAEDLLAICENLGLKQDRAVLQMIRCTMGTGIMTIGASGELDENSWRIGLDMAMLECEPDLAASDDLFATALERHAGQIFADVMMAAYASKLSQLVSTDNYKSAIEKPLMQKYMTDPDFRGRLSDTLAGAIAAAMKDLEDLAPAPGYVDRETLESELETARAEIASLRSAGDKAMAPLQARAERSEQKAKDLEAELSRLQSENEALYDALEKRDRKLSEYASRDQAPENLPDLPGDGVVFVGGHPNMLKKLQQDHPGWTFIASGDKSADPPRNPRLILFYDQHLSHPVYHKIRRAAGPSVPQAYLKSTNLDMLETEMRRAWAAAEDRGGPDE